MANSWGELSWGDGFYGLQNNGGVVLSGLDLSIAQGDPYSGENNGWGQFTWGFNEWGDLTNPNVDVTGIQLNISTGNEEAYTDVTFTLSTNLINTTVGTAVAGASAEVFLFGVLITSVVNSVFAGEVVAVAVTTPGTATTWGQYVWGEAAWGQISGTIAQTGDENISIDSVISLSTNLLNTTIGTLSIKADANVNASTNLLNTTVNSLIVTPNTIVDLTSPGNLPWGSEAWGYGTWGNIGGLDIILGTDTVAVPGVEVQVVGQQLNTTIGVLSITGTANVPVSNVSANISLGEEFAYTDVTAIPTGVLITSVVNTVYAYAETIVSPTGVQMTTYAGNLFINAWAVVDIGITNNWAVVDIAA